MLRPKCEVILFGDEEGTAEIASELGIRHIPDVERNEYGTPLVSSMFSIAQDTASHEVMCYVNADIILTSDFPKVVHRIKKCPFLLVGQRWDVDLKEPVDFSSPDWEERLRAYVAEVGKLHKPYGIDYFIFPRGQYHDIPPFAIGRPGWDNWMIHQACSLQTPVIDATKVITAFHQSHNYSHLPGGEVNFRKGPEAERNREFLGGPNHAFTVRDATWVLSAKGMKKVSPARILYQRGVRLRRSLISSTLTVLRRLRSVPKHSSY